MPSILEAPTYTNREETLSLVRGINKSESLRKQMPSLMKQQLDFLRVSKRWSSVINFNAPDVNTVQETKSELASICDEIIRQMTDLKASLA